MRSTLIRVEHRNRWLLAAVTGLGAVVLWNALPQSHPAGSESAPEAVSGSATTSAVSATPPRQWVPTQVDFDAWAHAALDSAEQYEDDGDYLECLRTLVPAPTTWWRRSESSEELEEALWLKKRDCTRRARVQADKAVRAKNYPAAIALLEPLVEYIQEGSFREVTVDGAWLLSDLAFAYQRNHQYVECIELLGDLNLVSGDENVDKLLKAVDYNLTGCHKRLDARYAIKSGRCRISIDGAIATAAASPPLAPRGAAAACVALIPGRKRPWNPGENEENPMCPVVALVWIGAKGTVERRELPTRDHHDALNEPDYFFSDLLNDGDFCRGLSSIAVGTKAGNSLVRLRGETEEHCQGRQCLYIDSLDVFYEWNGEVLTPVLDITY